MSAPAHGEFTQQNAISEDKTVRILIAPQIKYQHAAKGEAMHRPIPFGQQHQKRTMRMVVRWSTNRCMLAW